MNILLVGQSHIAAIRAAARTRRERDPERPRTRVIHTLEERYGGEFADATRSRFSPLLEAAIQDQLARHEPRVVSAIGGNAHNALALIRHARPFDFLLPDGEGPPFDAGSELVPLALVRSVLAERLVPDFARLRALQAIAGPFLHFESPPPVRDEAFIAARAEGWFRDRAGTMVQVGGAGLRWRIWRLASLLIGEAVEALGGRIVAVPGAAIDEEGFLKLDLAADPTHGNEAYGELLIRAIEAA